MVHFRSFLPISGFIRSIVGFSNHVYSKLEKNGSSRPTPLHPTPERDIIHGWPPTYNKILIQNINHNSLLRNWNIKIKLFSISGQASLLGSNFALNKPTFQSSTVHSGESSRAVDGDTNSAYNGNVSTLVRLYVDMGIWKIRTISLWNVVFICPNWPMSSTNFNVHVMWIKLTLVKLDDLWPQGWRNTHILQACLQFMIIRLLV